MVFSALIYFVIALIVSFKHLMFADWIINLTNCICQLCLSGIKLHTHYTFLSFERCSNIT